MSTTVSYGSISIIDVTDKGEFSVYPKSNLPSSVIYNPDQQGTTAYTPNWTTENLEITPSVWYAGSQVNNSNVDFTWQRRVGSQAATSLETGETVITSATDTKQKGTLVVSANKFSDSISMITYVVSATYREPSTNELLTAQGEITFTLTRQASTVKSITITGDSVFKYDTNGQVLGRTGTNTYATIVLDKRATNVTLSAWQYKNSSGNWVNYPSSNVTNSLTVRSDANTYHNASIFNNDKAIIRLVAASPDSDVQDIHVITNIYDGAVGQGTVTAVLTNEDQMIPFTPNGSTETGDFSSAISQIKIYRGGDGDVTSEYTITQTPTNVTTTPSTTVVANDTVSITGFTNNATTGSVKFSAKKTSEGQSAIPIEKTFSVIKVTSGVDGVSPTIYSLEPDALNLNKTRDTTPIYTPANVTFHCYSKVGSANGTTKTAYPAALRIYENISASEITSSTVPAYQTESPSVGEPSGIKTYTPTGTATSIVCRMYKTGSFSDNDLLDTQTVTITLEGRKGDKGDDGDAGESAINITLSNYFEPIPTNYNNIVTSQRRIEFDFTGWEGTSRVPTRIIPTIPTILGISYNSLDYSDSTSTSDGHISYTIPQGTNITSYGTNGNVTFTFRLHYDESDSSLFRDVTYDFSWAQTRNAKDGENVVFLQLRTPDGDVIENGSNNVRAVAYLYDGSADVSNSATYQWYQFSPTSTATDGYDSVPSATSKTLTIVPNMVNGYASFKCIATYNTNPYIQYVSVIDKSDPIQVTVLSSIGDKLLNNRGVGALYVKVSRKDRELDPIKSERFVEELPTTGVKNGDFIYLLDSTNKTVILKEYQNGWGNSTHQYTGNYSWTYRNKDGTIIHNGDSDGAGGTISTPATSGKVIYIDGSLVDKKLIADVTVTI